MINSRVVYPVYGQFCIRPFSLPFDTHNEIIWSPEYFHQILSGFGDIGQSSKMPKMGPKMENHQLIGQFSYEILKIGVYDLVWAKSWWPKPKRPIWPIWPIWPKIGRFCQPTAVWPAAALEKNAGTYKSVPGQKKDFKNPCIFFQCRSRPDGSGPTESADFGLNGPFWFCSSRYGPN